VLGFKVAVEADEEDDDGDGYEGCAEGLADVAEARFGGRRGGWGVGRWIGGDGGV
jgi:hypothetical protein